MIKNKILSVILAVCMSIAMLTPVSAEDTAPARLSEAYDIMSALGFIGEGYTIESIMEIGEVTRGEFVDAMYKVFGHGAKSSQAYFYDVPISHYAANAVAVFVENNAISVPESRMFYPDRIITRTEAAKLICYTLGYEQICTVYGGWTSGIEKVANDIELYNGADAANEVTYSDMIIMLYNAMFAQVFKISGIPGVSLDYEPTNDTYLSKYYNMYVNDGIVTAYDGISISGENSDEGEVKIGDLVLDANGIDAEEFLGLKVKYIYEYDESMDEYTLVWLKDLGRSEVISLNRKDNDIYFDTTSFELTYYDGDRTVTAQLERNINVVYNGSYVETGISSVLAMPYYSIRLIEGDNDKYSYAVIEDYDNYTLSSVESSGEVFYICACSDKTYESIKVEDYERIAISTADGRKITVDDIAEGDILSVMKSIDNKRITIIVSSKTVSGKLESYGTEDNCRVFTIDGQQYVAHDSNMTFTGISLGENVTLKLDAFGYVADASATEGGVRFGYLFFIGYDEFEDLFVFDIFDQSGEKIRYYAAESVYLDGQKFNKNLSGLYGALGGSSLVPQIIAFELNSEGEIDMIDTPEPVETAVKSGKNMFTTETEPVNYEYASESGKMGPKLRLGPNTIVFSVSTDMSEDRYRVGTRSNIISYRTDNDAIGYAYGLENKEFVDVVTTKQNWEMGGNTVMLVAKIYQSVNEDDEAVYVVEGYGREGEERTHIFAPEAANIAEKLAPGDLYGVVSRYNNEITSIEMRYDADVGLKVSNGTSYSTSSSRVIECYVNEVIGTSVRVGFNSGADYDEVFVPRENRIYVYDSERNKLERGTIGDIVSYELAGANCSRILQVMQLTDSAYTIIYK